MPAEFETPGLGLGFKDSVRVRVRVRERVEPSDYRTLVLSNPRIIVQN